MSKVDVQRLVALSCVMNGESLFDIYSSEEEAMSSLGIKNSDLQDYQKCKGGEVDEYAPLTCALVHTLGDREYSCVSLKSADRPVPVAELISGARVGSYDLAIVKRWAMSTIHRVQVIQDGFDPYISDGTIYCTQKQYENIETSFDEALKILYSGSLKQSKEMAAITESLYRISQGLYQATPEFWRSVRKVVKNLFASKAYTQARQLNTYCVHMPNLLPGYQRTGMCLFVVPRARGLAGMIKSERTCIIPLADLAQMVEDGDVTTLQRVKLG